MAVTPLLEPWQASVLDALAVLVLVTTAVIAITRDIVLAIKTYVVQACILVAMFLVVGAKYEWFVGWALSATVTKAVIVPWVLLWVVRRTSYVAEKEEPMVSTGAYLMLLAMIYALSSGLAHHVTTVSHVLARIGLAPLASALALVATGLAVVTLARNALKQVLGVVLFENGAHIMLASMAFYVPETVEVGIATDAVILIVILSLLAHRMVKIRGDMDVSKLVVLKF